MKYGLRVKAVYPLKTRHRYKGGFKIRIVFFVFPKAFFGFDIFSWFGACLNPVFTFMCFYYVNLRYVVECFLSKRRSHVFRTSMLAPPTSFVGSVLVCNYIGGCQPHCGVSWGSPL